MENLYKFLLGGIIMLHLNSIPVQAGTAKIDFIPISHASFVILADNAVICVDPTGDIKNYANIHAPDIILVTHSHFDHFDKGLIAALKKHNTVVIGPKEVIGKLSYGEVISNGESKMCGSINVEAVPAYNITSERLMNHPKGIGNGYVVTISGQRIYISGDTEDTPEMRSLKNIDYAFVCMNLPYTMSVEQAASAVQAFKPKIVFPYHFRQKNGFADVNKFKQLVAQDKNIEVKILKWY